MSPVVRLAGAVGVLIAVVACSSSPPKAPPPTARTQPAAVAPSTAAPAATAPGAPTAMPASASSAPPAGAASSAAQVDAKLVSKGYRAFKYKGSYVYCRAEPVTGTQFKKKVCLTEEAIRDLEQKTQETVDSMTKQRTGPACFPGVNCSP